MSYYSASSTYRKDEKSSRYQSKNQNPRQEVPPRQELSATARNLSSHKQSLMQQQQVADLQRKIDLILMHNEKLESQKQRYRLMLEEIRSQYTDRALQSNTARFISEENDFVIDKLHRQLQVSAKTYERRLNQAFESRQILKQQIQTLSKIIEQLSQENRDLKLVIKQQSLKVDSLAYELKEQFIRQQAQLQNKLRDEFLIRQIELKNQKKQTIDVYQAQIQDLKAQFSRQIQQINEDHQQKIKSLMEQAKGQRQTAIKDLKQNFKLQKQSIDENQREQLKKEQQKAIQYIKDNISNLESNNEQNNKEYQDEIDKLRQSLQARKRLIDTILAEQSQPSDHLSGEKNIDSLQRQSRTQISWFPQLMSLKQQMRHLTNQYLQQSQLLKLKLTQKFQIDVRELKTIYEDKIQLMALHTQRVEEQNTRLRDIYEKTLQTQIQVKKDFELEKSKLKNFVRKLKVELHGIQEEFRINIEGVKDQNNTFSMTMMKSMIQVKEKANFFSEENRKLRKAYEQHYQQTISTVSQGNQKIKYYETKYQSVKLKLDALVNEYNEKIQLTQLQAEERQNNLRDNLNKQHEMIHTLVQGLRKDVDELTNQNQSLSRKCHELQCSFKEKDQDIAYFKSKVDQLQADIQRLKMDLQMAGVNDKDKTDTINQWKSHYQTIIAQLQDEKNIINKKLVHKDDQLVQVIKKYQILEHQFKELAKNIKKRSELQKKVVQLGIDTNLVKNLNELFERKSARKNKENQQN